jgi:hypothetical protein
VTKNILLLCADEEHRLAGLCRLTHDLGCGLKTADRLVEINDVNAIALGEDEGLHLRIPAARLVAKVCARLEQVLNWYCHNLYNSWVIWFSLRPSSFATRNR